MRTKKPLGRSITAGCVMFMAVLCLSLSIFNYIFQRKTLYERYQTFMTDIIHYVDRRIDDEDLQECIRTGQESEKYRETLRFMDQIMNDFSIHYLYVIKPLNLNETGNMMVVMSAEDDYNRYEDPEGNLYLGWVSEDEYSPDIVRKFQKVMEGDRIVFFTEKTEWSTDYTGAMPLKDREGNSYAVLATDVDVTALYSELYAQALGNAGVILGLGILFTILFLLWANKNVTEPILKLENGVVDFAGRSHGQRNVELLKFEAPDIRTDNEVEALSDAITQMTEDMQEYVQEILTAEEKTRTMKKLADEMSELATIDALTRIRNKTAYAQEVEKIDNDLSENPEMEFGMAMIDLNYLKFINDTYGHETGDKAIVRLSRIACEVFSRSPVFRIGGDEFGVILRNQDYQDRDLLEEKFRTMVSDHLSSKPWINVSASIGIAVYDSDQDTAAEDVMNRADQKMYAMKKEMKAERS